MTLMTDFPPDLDTPFNDALAFLFRVVGDEREQYFLKQLAEYQYFSDIHPLDQAAFYNLLDEFNYFDLPARSVMPPITKIIIDGEPE